MGWLVASSMTGGWGRFEGAEFLLEFVDGFAVGDHGGVCGLAGEGVGETGFVYGNEGLELVGGGVK